MLGQTHKEKSSTSLPQPNGYGATDSTPTLNATNYGAIMNVSAICISIIKMN